MKMKQTKRNDRNATHLICTKCKCIKLVCEYYIRKTGSFESKCKSCINKYRRDYDFKRRNRKINKQGHTGVTYRPDRDLYYARIVVNGKLIHLGKAATAAEAGEIYQEALKKKQCNSVIINRTRSKAFGITSPVETPEIP